MFLSTFPCVGDSFSLYWAIISLRSGTWRLKAAVLGLHCLLPRIPGVRPKSCMRTIDHTTITCGFKSWSVDGNVYKITGLLGCVIQNTWLIQIGFVLRLMFSTIMQRTRPPVQYTAARDAIPPTGPAPENETCTYLYETYCVVNGYEQSKRRLQAAGC